MMIFFNFLNIFQFCVTTSGRTLSTLWLPLVNLQYWNASPPVDTQNPQFPGGEMVPTWMTEMNALQ